MPGYYFIMAAYALLSAFIVAVLIYNLFKSESIWEQIIAFFVIYPFVFRLLLIK
ncbi:MAG: hypothetical protein FWG97_02880 [Deltaproteobacteria bacterium]|nr:hypothetical protein [Deltaproteobacteria bacterium]